MDADERTWMRDLGALLALPSLWVDHAAVEIADGLLSVLFGMLRLDAGYGRFESPRGADALEVWRPTASEPPAELLAAVRRDHGEGEPVSGVATSAVRAAEAAGGTPPSIARVTTLVLALPWGTGLVAVSAPRADFPTERETHLLRVAVGQAAIALHTARRLAGEQAARREAERERDRQSRLLRTLLDEVGPALTAVSRRVQQASREAERAEPARPGAPAAVGAAAAALEAPAEVPGTLTRRELEVLGLLAQGLSNKEMAGVMWLSDRTVERHITSLYRKIGVARRSEATAFALRHGIA
ncbi:response regulator transcription factor [Leifsonia xyli]|uniref:helix-turn-helix transcriptional regulator n=1 Tax=Leifsonia xyli TaxID=1575 RepID=UPI003D67252D